MIYFDWMPSDPKVGDIFMDRNSDTLICYVDHEVWGRYWESCGRIDRGAPLRWVHWE